MGIFLPQLYSVRRQGSNSSMLGSCFKLFNISCHGELPNLMLGGKYHFEGSLLYLNFIRSWWYINDEKIYHFICMFSHYTLSLGEGGVIPEIRTSSSVKPTRYSENGFSSIRFPIFEKALGKRMSQKLPLSMGILLISNLLYLHDHCRIKVGWTQLLLFLILQR